jgi:uncharacterized oxidoreductase
VREHPALNILINNAGIMRREDLTRTRDLADAEETIITNLLRPIRLTNALTDHLVRQPDAAIVNVSSGLGKVEVIEIAPPAVQAELTPGQSTREGYMPLDEFIDEGMGLFQLRSTPKEILDERVGSLRWAERDGRFDQMVEMLSTN